MELEFEDILFSNKILLIQVDFIYELEILSQLQDDELLEFDNKPIIFTELPLLSSRCTIPGLYLKAINISLTFKK